ncbi:helix-turn-helix domain-containing protein [Fibrella aquatica]|jgi:DNA-binding XRE family transcriptional regulator|uniref:helix-turn-helix domain-containing protein n=1 Tax=Fibrella aquatica TaxID=3242487 RepID=UPI003521B7B7
MNTDQLAALLVRRRQILSIRQEDLAAIAGVSLRTVKAIESGRSNPRWQTVEQLTKVLGLTITIELP